MSPMGSSAGRSRAHRTGEGARRRYTEREREAVDAPGEALPLPWMTPRGERMMAGASWATLAAIAVLLALVALGVVRG